MKCKNTFRIFLKSIMEYCIVPILLTLQLISPIYGSTNSIPRLTVSVYYESLCPDSINFIADQLTPAYNDLKDWINLEFIPFGKSSSQRQGQQFICQHGPAECRGNMIQSCGLNALPNTDQKMEFVACQMQRGADPSGQRCMNSVSPNGYQAIVQCINSSAGRQLQLLAEVQTKQFGNPQLKFVPTIIYNNQFSQSLQDRSLNDFPNVVCEQLGNQPPVCQQERSQPFPIYVYNFFTGLFQ